MNPPPLSTVHWLRLDDEIKQTEKRLAILRKKRDTWDPFKPGKSTLKRFQNHCSRIDSQIVGDFETWLSAELTNEDSPVYKDDETALRAAWDASRAP